MKPVHRGVAFAFYRHSIEAFIVYELALQLYEGGRPWPLHLFVSKWSAPELAYARGTTYEPLRSGTHYGALPPQGGA